LPPPVACSPASLAARAPTSPKSVLGLRPARGWRR
jgi:hypothetical protein